MIAPYLRRAAVAFCLLALLPLPVPSAEKDRPNLLLVFLDDLGYADVGFNAELFGIETDVVTPTIDALAKEGAIFKQAYVAHPFCGPSRMALMTGRMPHTFGGQKNLPNHALDLEDYNLKGVPTSEPLISTVLKDAGYRTGVIGKWHLGYAPDFHPNQRGFDEFYGFLGGGHQYFPSVTDKVEPKVNDYQYFLERNGKEIRSPEGAYLTDTLSEEAAEFIRESSRKDQPFFLYLAYNAPHSPLQGKAEDLAHLYPDHEPENPANGIDYRDYEGRQNYVAMMYAVDRGLDLIRETLEDPNGDGDVSDSIADDTLIVFLSDNGGKILQAGNNAPLQDDKGSTHEGGIRVPMFMHWPGKLPAGSLYDHPINALDLYPTFAGLVEATLPEGKQLDGVDAWDAIVAGKDARPEQAQFWVRHHGGGNEVALRKGNLKAYRKQFGAWSLFDVTADPGEQTDLAKEHPDFLRALISEGLEWSHTLQDPQWHDTAAGLESWKTRGMPHYERTFQVR